MAAEEQAGGRIFFSSVRRSLEEEDEVRLTSVGIDIGSSTSHLVFSRLVMERLDNRYVVAQREIVHESEVLLTPYAADLTIDAAALGRFIAAQYASAGLDRASIDTGALILTGVAVRRRNARAIADLFAQEAGKFVAVSAGDALEATLAAFGSGAVAASIRERCRVMNVDVGGGTSKIALCDGGEIVEVTAIDIGARIVVFDTEGRVARAEEAARRLAADLDIDLAVGARPRPADVQRLVERMADRLLEAMRSPSPSAATRALLRLEPLANARPPDAITFSGGVAEYLYGREARTFGDLGPSLAQALAERVQTWEPRLEPPIEGIRATVVGASQYTIQVSGSTIFVAPPQTLPLRNVPVVRPELPLAAETLDVDAIAHGVRVALRRLDLHDGAAVALGYGWQGSATYDRLDAFCRGVARGLDASLARGHPLVLVGEGDIGGLVGIHCREEARLANAVVSIDGIRLSEFDFIDIGALLETSGAVPVVIKSLVFPATTAVGRVRQAEPA